MPEKRYQIFVSSTFSDLQIERQKIFSAIMMLNHIPAGMEFFSAIDEEQMEFIQKVIDESDYYVLLLGARYGSLDENGVSYTEREYDYAISKGLKVIALLHSTPDSIERGKTDKNEDLFKKFLAFREKVSGNKRLVSYWNNTEELLTKFQASLIRTIQHYPAIGWVRGNISTSEKGKTTETLTIQKSGLISLLNEIIGKDISKEIKPDVSIPLMLNSETVRDLQPYLKLNWIKMRNNGSTTNLGAGNRVGNLIEDMKNPWGMGSGFILTIMPTFFE